MSVVIVTKRIPEGSSPTLTGRINGPDGIPLNDADVSSYSFYIYDLTSQSPREPIYSLENEPPPLLLSELVLDSFWRQDGEGYNFIRQVDAATFGCKGMHKYSMQLLIQCPAFGLITAVFEPSVVPRIGTK